LREVMGGQTAYFAKTMIGNLRCALISLTVSIVVSTLSLFVTGATALVLYEIVPRMMPSWMNDGKVVVYLHSDSPAAESEKLAQELTHWQQIESVYYVSKEEARHRMENQLGDFKSLLGGIGKDFLPPSLEISLKAKTAPHGDVEEVVEKIRGFRQVEEVFSRKSCVEKLESAIGVLKLTGLGVVCFLFFLAVLVISGKIRRSLAARQDEMEIYDILGAKPLFVKAPFYMEGVFQGIASAMLAILLLVYLLSLSRKALPLPIVAAFSLGGSSLSVLIAGVLSCGAVLGLIGSWLALRWPEKA
jgi:cell division transport system permease protein